MKPVILYIVVPSNPSCLSYVSRFVATLSSFTNPAQYKLIAVCNGGPPSSEVRAALSICNAEILPRSNDGWDIGAYLELSKQFASQTPLICLGESVYFRKAGWIDRIYYAWRRRGEGMYGFWSSNLIRPHLLTTGFVCSAGLLARYPKKVLDRKSRYEFEHGKQPFHAWVSAQERPVMLLTWNGFYTARDWRRPPNILWKGDQSNCLCYCNHTDRFEMQSLRTKKRWGELADTGR